jgi:hypothetical protein
MTILLDPQELTVRRYTQAYVNHEITTTLDSTFTVTAEVQPAPGEVRDDLPEGYRTTRLMKLFTSSALRILEVKTQAPGDVVEYQGDDWEVIQGKDRSTWDVPVAHRWYIIARLGVDE